MAIKATATGLHQGMSDYVDVTFNRAHSGRPVGALWERENRRITTPLDGWEPYL